ncbi:Fibronectin type III domain-containing protein [Actinokineospora alba]|uniref:Fibronectin type III domain-containing protein n=1 Tax=Actinokineospora alba TaxID=504798 RepID=A0A1H0LV84_9PSEU|nr:DUF6801 domain-containing protein [Actinokineospora alba]TDP67468.1 fibronectin type III domain protein [Actinokineospora alba]SDI95627.1 Fibronectin type III domain-containing protein [Actinokineospora alba]SDO71981.1 Fibronectin type III domain-containing protein [Actinokineospora alba]
MGNRPVPLLSRRIAAAALTVAVTATGIAAGARTAAAEPDTLTQTHTCVFPVIETQPVISVLSADLPQQVIGRTMAATQAELDVTLSADTAMMFPLLKTATVEGTVAVEFDITRTVNGQSDHVRTSAVFTVARTPLPAAPGPMPLVGAGVVPGLEMTGDGVARIDLTRIDLTLTLRKPDGTLVNIPDSLNPFTRACTLDPGQNNTLSAITFTHGDPGPDTPKNVRATAVSASSVSLAWDESWPGIGTVDGYEVFANGAKVATTVDKATTATVTGLAPDTAHTFTVRTYPTWSEFSTPLTVRTWPAVLRPVFDLSGTAKVKAANTSVTVAGSAAAEYNPASGAFTADLALKPAPASTKWLGIVPVTAEVGFVPEGKLAGTFTGAGLTVSAKVGITLSKLTVFGFPVAAPACRTVAPVVLDLRSAGVGATSFPPGGPGPVPPPGHILPGGTVSGGFSIPAFAGCEPYAGMVSTMVSGPDNTLELGLRAR